MFPQRGSIDFPPSFAFSEQVPPSGSDIQLASATRLQRQWTPKAQWLAFLLIIITIFAIGLVIAVAILGVQVIRTHLQKPCSDSICVQVAGSILSKMNTSVDPCQDFYKFACGTWIKETSVPPEETSWGQIEIIRQKLARELREILEDVTTTVGTTPRSFMLAQQFYQTCLISDGIQQHTNNSELLMTIDHLLGNSDSLIWTNFTTILSNIRKEVDGNYIFSFEIDVDVKNSSRYAFYLDHPKFVIPPAYLSDPEENEHRKRYLTLIEMAWKSVYVTEEARAKVIAGDILKIEATLASISTIHSGRVNMSLEYRQMELNELRNLTKEERALEWEVYFDQVFSQAIIFNSKELSTYNKEFGIWQNNSRRSPAALTFPIVMQDEVFFQKLGSVLQVDYNGRDILNYLKWRLIFDLGSQSSTALRQLFFEYTKAKFGQLMPVPKWRYCVDTTNSVLSAALSYRYVQKHFSPGILHEAEMLVEDLHQVFHQSLSTATWLSTSTRKLAIEKLEKMQKFIGYPKWMFYETEDTIDEYYKTFQDLTSPQSHFSNFVQFIQWHTTRELTKVFTKTDLTDWFVEPTEVNAFYSYFQNAISIPFAILQPPFFRMPMQVLNYAAIGEIIGHEMTHGFDDEGRQVDVEGNLREWLDAEALTSYMDKSKCFVDQYQNFTVNFDDTTWHVDGNLTLSENIADNGGLRHAFDAYKLYSSRTGTENSLPGLEKYTAKQLFFISFAQTWCEVATPQLLQHVLSTDGHTPSEFRVNGVLHNFDEFDATWNCLRNTSNHSNTFFKTCRIW